MAETASGMLNSIGLQGPGIDAFVEHDLAWLASVGARVLVSIAGNTAEEFGDVAQRLASSPAFDAVVTGESPFDELPDVMARLAAGRLPAICHTITYGKE